MKIKNKTIVIQELSNGYYVKYIWEEGDTPKQTKAVYEGSHNSATQKLTRGVKDFCLNLK